MAETQLRTNTNYLQPERSVNFAETAGEPLSGDDLFKRSDFLRNYLKQEKDDVVVGGYTPTVDDSKNLQKQLIENVNLSHPGEGDIEDVESICVPLCIGLKSVENVLWHYSIFSQVYHRHVLYIRGNFNHSMIEVIDLGSDWWG